MRIINGLLAAWHEKTTAEKIKMVLHGIVMIGGGAIGSTIGDKCAAGKGRITGVCTKVTGFALGSVVADAAAQSLDKTVDAFDELIQDRKNDCQKEEEENA